MNKKSFYDFKQQFDNNYINNVKVPYNVILNNFVSDVTTYDNILDYFTPKIISDSNSISCNFIPVTNNEYSYPNVNFYEFTIKNSLDYIEEYSSQMMNPDYHCIGVKLSPDNTSIYVKKPFEDTTIYLTESRKCNKSPVINFYYSSFNEYLILPRRYLENDYNFKDFATEIYKFEDDSTKTENSFQYDLNIFPIGAQICLNKNFKYNINFDSSLLGVKNSNTFQWKSNTKYQNNNTDVDSTIIDSYYEYESTYKINGQLLIDSNISQYYGHNNLNIDSTVLIFSEDFTINRAHVPPMRYLEIGDFHVNEENKYQPIISFNTKNNFNHVKIKHDNHSQFSESKSINDIVNGRENNTNAEFLLEFSGYNEVIEL